ncbi:unnamed protein product [Lampetra planeri]
MLCTSQGGSRDEKGCPGGKLNRKSNCARKPTDRRGARHRSYGEGQKIGAEGRPFNRFPQGPVASTRRRCPKQAAAFAGLVTDDAALMLRSFEATAGAGCEKLDNCKDLTKKQQKQEDVKHFTGRPKMSTMSVLRIATG